MHCSHLTWACRPGLGAACRQPSMLNHCGDHLRRPLCLGSARDCRGGYKDQPSWSQPGIGLKTTQAADPVGLAEVISGTKHQLSSSLCARLASSCSFSQVLIPGVLPNLGPRMLISHHACFAGMPTCCMPPDTWVQEPILMVDLY